jgi:hypothetical protein
MQTPSFSGPPRPSYRRRPARFNHAYGFSGDHVRLDAELLVATPPVELGAPAVGLRRTLRRPCRRRHLVAQVPIGPLSPSQRRAAAFPPAGHGTHTMVLVLAAGHDGRFDEVHDYANYPRRESFAQPEINGPAGFELGDDSATLHAAGITNPAPRTT